MRISLVIGIYKALNIYFGEPWADRWVTLENRGPLFAGQAPIEYMVRHGQPGMIQVRRLLDTWRGGRLCIPPLLELSRDGMHRLIPSRFSESGTVLAGVAENSAMLEDLVLLDGATNDRLLGEQAGLIGIGLHELLYGVPGAHIVNAAFTHTNEQGARFNDHTRGAWYAADELETSLAEVTYHKAKRLAQIVVPELPRNRPESDVSTYDDWLADFRSKFHVTRAPWRVCGMSSG